MEGGNRVVLGGGGEMLMIDVGVDDHIHTRTASRHPTQDICRVMLGRSLTVRDPVLCRDCQGLKYQLEAA